MSSDDDNDDDDGERTLCLQWVADNLGQWVFHEFGKMTRASVVGFVPDSLYS